MPNLNIRGVVVDFPFQPYDCQRAYMEKVIEGLQTGSNCLLESPTGTGKTLCLLCATLGWREAVREYASMLGLIANPSTGSVSLRYESGSRDDEVLESLAKAVGSVWVQKLHNGGTRQANFAAWQAPATNRTGGVATSGENFGGLGLVPRILYTSRTHSQLAQVIRELKSTVYHPRVTVLGSRDQMCVHPKVSEAKGSMINNWCRALVSTRACAYKNELESSLSALKNSGSNIIMDIEELVTMGKEHRICPFYYSREVQSSAEIVFVPYNYLIDPVVRKTLTVDWDSSVVIFDEAHNLEGVAEESASFDLSVIDVAHCHTEVSDLIGQFDDIKANSSKSISASKFRQSPLTMHDLRLLDAFFAAVEGDMAAWRIPDPEQGLTKPGPFIYDLLAKWRLTPSSYQQVSEVIDKVLDKLSEDDGKRSASLKLEFFQKCLQRAFRGSSPEELTRMASYYKVHIHLLKDSPADNRKSNNSFVRAPGSHHKQKTVLSYWCFNPGIAVEELSILGVHCIILTSGTLSPLPSLAQELRIPFPIQLENPHVINSDQVFAGVLRKGVTGVALNSSYQSRTTQSYLTELGLTVANLSKVVPHGMLTFFPSYSSLDSAVRSWQATSKYSLWARLASSKPPVIEPRRSSDFKQVVEQYNKFVETDANGAVMLAVCRGKVSEGIDFADHYGRAVIITGLPFPPLKDPRVVLKRQYLDELHRSSGGKTLSGNEWYAQQALRAVNQAIGRVIRHRHDFGAIILCDERFSNSSNTQLISKWVHPFLKVYDDFGKANLGMIQFFKKHRAAGTANQGEGKPINQGGSSGTGSSNQLGKKPIHTIANPVLGQQSFSQVTVTNVELANGLSYIDPDLLRKSSKPQHKKRKRDDTGVAGLADVFSKAQHDSTSKDSGALPAGPSSVASGNVPKGAPPSLSENSTLSGRYLLENQTPNATQTNARKATAVASMASRQSESAPKPTRKGFGLKAAEKRSTPQTSVTFSPLQPVKRPEQSATKIKSFLDDARNELSPSEFQNFQSLLRTIKAAPQSAELESRFGELVQLLSTGTATRRALLTTFKAFLRPELLVIFDRCTQKNKTTGSPSASLMDTSTIAVEKRESKIVCLICTQQAKSPLINRGCGHICCTNCWIRWLQNKTICPACRQPLTKRDLAQLVVKRSHRTEGQVNAHDGAE